MSLRVTRPRTLACLAGLVGIGAGLAAGCSSSTPTSATSASRAIVASVTAPPAGPKPGVLAGKVVGIDPGHNGRNYADPSFINHLIWNGREE